MRGILLRRGCVGCGVISFSSVLFGVICFYGRCLSCLLFRIAFCFDCFFGLGLRTWDLGLDNGIWDLRFGIRRIIEIRITFYSAFLLYDVYDSFNVTIIRLYIQLQL